MVPHVRAQRHAVTRVFLRTFGCKANQYDTEVVRQALEAAGIATVDSPAEAEVAIINSCTVTHVSESKMRGLVRRISRSNPECSSIIVIGCAATMDKGTIRSIPGVTSVIAGTDPKLVLGALGLSVTKTDPILRTFDRGTRAWLKIQDGCDERCTYCATRIARGKSMSRSPTEILQEAKALASKHAEIVLTGIHIGSYGSDLEEELTLHGLVSLLVNDIPEVRFRLSSVEATQIDDGLIELMAGAADRLAPHVHAPLQSGSDRILKLMGRHWYTAAEYRRRLEDLASRVPTLGLGADVIVGFPGETEADFRKTLSLIEALPYTYLHVFPYSPRSETPSVKLRPTVGPDAARRRSSELRKLADSKNVAYRASRHGELSDVVFIRRIRGRFEGLTEDYLPVLLQVEAHLPPRFGAKLQYRDDSLWAEPTAI